MLVFVDPFGANVVAALVERSGHSIFLAPSPDLLAKAVFFRRPPSLGRFVAAVKSNPPYCRGGRI
jgi:hypothetical protein